MEPVEKSRYEGPVKVGIGTKEQEAALRAAGCEKVFSVAEIEGYLDENPILLTSIFRDGDTAVMVQPGQLPMPLMRKIASTGIEWQVPGHDPVTFQSDEDRTSWRRQKPRGVPSIQYTAEAKGRPPKWPVPSSEAVAALLADWDSAMKRSLVVERMRGRVGADVPMSWCRDQVIKSRGSAKRNKPQEGQGDGQKTQS